MTSLADENYPKILIEINTNPKKPVKLLTIKVKKLFKNLTFLILFKASKVVS